MGRYLGVDAAGKLGWVGVLIDDAGFVSAATSGLSDLVAAAEPIEAIAVDIPIGNRSDQPRRAEAEARRLLGRRSATMFNAPPPFVLDAPDQAEANRRCEAQGWPKMSAQAWGLVGKVNETAALAVHDERMIEVHPELAFLAMADGQPTPPKKTWAGMQRRVALLSGEGIELPATHGAETAPVDDVLDAAAAAWTARRFAAGLAQPLPAEPEIDPRTSRRLAIWF